MEKILHIALLILATNLWSLSVAQAQTTLENLERITEKAYLNTLGIKSDKEKEQFIADMEAYTKADFALRTMLDKKRDIGPMNLMSANYTDLAQFSIKVNLFNTSKSQIREFKNKPELKPFFKAVNNAFDKGKQAGEEAGAAETSDADFVSKVNEYAAILKKFEVGTFGKAIKVAEK